jgi:adenylylsulfate kinase-like enzyme
MIYVLYGQPGSGKTTLSQLLCTHIQHQPDGNEAVIIDGDKFRELFKQTDYSTTGRENNITAANTVATYISQIHNVDVILALVNPYAHLRAELRANNSLVTEILLESDRDVRIEYHVDNFELGEPDHIINTDSLPDDTWSVLKGLLFKPRRW